MGLLENTCRLCRKEYCLPLYLLLLCYSLRSLSSHFFYGFLFGLFNALLVLFLLFQYTLLSRIKRKYSDCKSLFDYASIKIDEMIQEPSA